MSKPNVPRGRQAKSAIGPLLIVRFCDLYMSQPPRAPSGKIKGAAIAMQMSPSHFRINKVRVARNAPVDPISIDFFQVFGRVNHAEIAPKHIGATTKRVSP